MKNNGVICVHGDNTVNLGLQEKTRNTFGDGFLVAMAAVWTLSSITLLGLGTVSIESFASLSTTVFTFAGISISYAAIFSFIAPILAYVLNNEDLTDFNNYQTIAAVVIGIMVAGVTISPPLAEYLAGNNAAAWIYFLVQGVAFFAIAGLETVEKDVLGGVTP